jgi:serine-type D-Ala-D-Ala carboxypeptidase (penicillin-binding protein 5/6)
MTTFKPISVASAWHVLLLAFAFLLAAPAAQAQTFDTTAPHVLLMDHETGTVLMERAADEPTGPASLVKIMTAEIVFHAVKEGHLSLDDEFTVSEYAWRTGGARSGGSTMFAELGSQISVGDLLRGMLVQSGNDAAIVLAEGMAGTELAFADLMNQRARELGMRDSVFRNASGLPDPEQHVTMRDMVILARHILEAHPDFYPIFAEPDFTWNNIRQRNRLPLLDAGIGVDGIKTGHTAESGYGLVASAQSGDRRLVLAINGLESARERETEARKLLEWGFRAFEPIIAFEEGEVVGQARVFGGVQGRVALRADGPLRVLVPRAGDPERLRARIVYNGPIPAPVAEGTRVGSFNVWRGEQLIQETPLYTAEAVDTGPLHRRAFDALSELLFGWI